MKENKKFANYSNLDDLLLKSAKQKYKLYVDLDGVLADFVKGFKDITGEDPDTFKKTRSEKELWAAINSNKTFFADLDMMSDAQELWNALKKFNPTILTTTSRLPRSVEQKKQWVKEHLGKDVNVITVPGTKEEYAAANAILIDDMDKNLIPWKEEGGIGIKHTSAKKTLKSLQKYLDF